MQVEIKRGLNLRLDGAPEQAIMGRVASDTVGLLPADYRGFAAKLMVAVGDTVAMGQPLLHDRKTPELVCTSSAAGRIKAIERGARRRIRQIIVSTEGNRAESFPAFDSRQIEKLGPDEIRRLLLKSGLWTAIRARPFECIASPDIRPRAVFITAIDSNPLAPDPTVVLEQREDDFVAGVGVLAQLPSGNTYVCTAQNSDIPVPDTANIQRVEFSGPHPAGLPGTHLHAVGLAVGREPDLWHVGYQDVAAIGRLFLRGRLDTERVISLAGPGVQQPGLLQVRLGTRLSALPVPHRDTTQQVIAGPLLGLAGAADFLGRFHLQVSVFPANATIPKSGGIWRNAALRLMAAPRRATSLPAAVRPRSSMLPVEVFERVWPYRTPPAALLRALLIGDPVVAAQLGCLGLAEEDLALCNLVCPAGQDYAAALTRTLQRIESQQ